MRAVLNEQDFRDYINNGFVIKDGRKIWFKKSELTNLTAGDVVTQGDIEFILSDIGYDKIYSIIKVLPYLQ